MKERDSIYRLVAWLQGFACIADGLSKIISFGFWYTSFSYRIAWFQLRRSAKRRDKIEKEI